MKKTLKFLTGVAFIISILIAAGCTSVKVPQASEDMAVVHIYMKDTLVGGNHHLLLWDSNNPNKKVVDNLITNVKEGSEVYWLLEEDSGLKKIKKVAPKEANGNIMPEPAKGNFIFTGYKKHIVPGNQKPGEEKYIIKVKDEGGNKWEIDPHLKIPPEV